MDLRVKRTRNNIINAFIELRSKKELDKITVKELAALACINKATFYQYYKDIYDLSEVLETEVLTAGINDLNHPEILLTNPREGVRELANALLSRQPLLDILYSGSRRPLMVSRIEKLLKEVIYTNRPEYRDDLEKDILITFLIQGTFRAYDQHRQDDQEKVLEILVAINEKIIADIQ
jgi:AcrR family transcriptional regulator